MVNAAGCVCVQFCTCVEDSTSMLCSALLQLFTLLCAVVLVVRWRCLVAGATKPQGSVVREVCCIEAVTPTLSSSRSLWWSSNDRTKPTSTHQLRNSPTIASVPTSGVNAIAHWKDKPAECLENAAIYAVANLWQSILTIKFLEDKRSQTCCNVFDCSPEPPRPAWSLGNNTVDFDPSASSILLDMDERSTRSVVMACSTHT